jgi:hypothetical protein
MQSGRSTLELLQLAREANLIQGDVSPALLRMIDRSESAQNILREALTLARTDGGRAIEEAMHAARTARNWMIAGNTIGFAAEAFGMWMAWAEYQENGAAAEQTTNPALRELYRTKQTRNFREGVISASLFVWNTVCVGVAWNASGSFLVGLSTPATAAALPVAVASAVGSYLARRVEDVAQEWSSEARDFLGKSDAELLQRMHELSPGTIELFQWSAVDLWDWTRRSAEQGANRVESGNTNTRDNLLRAYFMRNSRVPRSPSENDRTYNERLNTSVRDSEEFMRRVGGRPDGRNLRMSLAYAEMVSVSRALRASGDSEVIRWTVEGREYSLDLATVETLDWSPTGDGLTRISAAVGFMLFQQQMTAQEVASIARQHREEPASHPEHGLRSIQTILMREIATDLQRLDGVFLASHPASSLDIHGDGARRRFRYLTYTRLREALRTQSNALLREQSVSPDQLARAIEAIRSVIPTPNGAAGNTVRFYRSWNQVPQVDGAQMVELRSLNASGDIDKVFDPQWLLTHLNTPEESPHPHSEGLWESAATVLASWGATPADLGNGIIGYRITYGTAVHEFTSVAGRICWRSMPAHAEWKSVTDRSSYWSDEARKAVPDRENANALAAQLAALETRTETPQLAEISEREGRDFIGRLQPLPQGCTMETRVIDGRNGYRITMGGARMEIVHMSGLWMWRSDRGIWRNPADYFPGYENPEFTAINRRLVAINGGTDRQSIMDGANIDRASSRFRAILEALAQGGVEQLQKNLTSAVLSRKLAVDRGDMNYPDTQLQQRDLDIGSSAVRDFPDISVRREGAGYVIASLGIRIRMLAGEVQWRQDGSVEQWTFVDRALPYTTLSAQSYARRQQEQVNQLLRRLAGNE